MLRTTLSPAFLLYQLWSCNKNKEAKDLKFIETFNKKRTMSDTDTSWIGEKKNMRKKKERILKIYIWQPVIALLCPLTLFIFPAFIPWQWQKTQQAKTNLAAKGQKTSREPQQVLTFLGEDGADGYFIVGISKMSRVTFQLLCSETERFKPHLTLKIWLFACWTHSWDSRSNSGPWKVSLIWFLRNEKSPSFISPAIFSDESAARLWARSVCCSWWRVQFFFFWRGGSNQWLRGHLCFYDFVCIVWQAYRGALKSSSNPLTQPLKAQAHNSAKIPAKRKEEGMKRALQRDVFIKKRCFTEKARGSK